MTARGMGGPSDAFGPAVGRRTGPPGPPRLGPTEGGVSAFFRGPAEGWSALVLVLLMLAMVALAVDGSRWAGYGVGEGSQTAFLLWAVLLGAGWGFLAAKSQLSMVGSHALGALLGTLFLLVAVSGVISPEPGLGARLEDLSASMQRFSYDLFVQGVRSAETSAFLLVVGGLAWVTGHFAAFNVFRRQRPVPAVAAAGTLLLVNMSVTIENQYFFLVVFSACALLLLVRLNLVHQQKGWLRRRIGDAGYVSGLFLRGGIAFVLVALVGSLGLAATASSAPLAGAWRDVDDQLVRMGGALNQVVGGVSGAAKGPNGLFSSTQRIRGVWESSTEVVFRARASDAQGHYMRAGTYDYFDGTSWQQRDRTEARRVPAGEPLLGGSPDLVVEELGRRPVDVTITAAEYNSDLGLAPETPFSAAQETDVFLSQEGGPFAAFQLTAPLRTGESYSVRSLVRSPSQRSGAITANQLSAAGTTYPEWVKRYIEIPEGSIGDITRDTTARIVAELPRGDRSPYQIAAAIQRYLYSDGGFQYDTDVRGLCGSQNLVDCFLTAKVGYCEYFATGMAMMLRTQEIPARMAMGYLPGRQLDDGSWEVDRGAAHAWVEVYFPDHGWVRFDPTPGNQENGQRPTLLPAGPRVGGASPDPNGPRASFRTDDPPDGDDLGSGEVPGGTSLPGPGTAGTTGSPTGQAIPILVALVVALAIGGAALAYLRLRRPADTGGELVYRGVTRLAGRLGYGPLPTQTVYEYAGTLGELVPAVRSDLELVARAKVEATYGRRESPEDLLLALRTAYRRIRVRLLRLAFRRPARKRRLP